MNQAPDPLTAFVETVLENLRKNGYPARSVAFPLERMYEAADRKGLSFNKVLDVLATRGVPHEKTPERVVFAAPPMEEPGQLPDFDLDALAKLGPAEREAFARKALASVDPAQLEAIRRQVEGMSDEERAALLEQAKRLGLA